MRRGKNLYCSNCSSERDCFWNDLERDRVCHSCSQYKQNSKDIRLHSEVDYLENQGEIQTKILWKCFRLPHHGEGEPQISFPPFRRPGVKEVRTDELAWPALRCQETNFSKFGTTKGIACEKDFCEKCSYKCCSNCSYERIRQDSMGQVGRETAFVTLVRSTQSPKKIFGFFLMSTILRIRERYRRRFSWKCLTGFHLKTLQKSNLPVALGDNLIKNQFGRCLTCFPFKTLQESNLL